MVGAGLNLFASEQAEAGAGGEETPAGPPADPLKPVLDARDTVFVQKTLQAPANTPIEVDFENKGSQPHNVHFVKTDGGSDTLADGAKGEVITGPGASEKLTFTTPGPGTYYYICDVHPAQMKGVLTVQ